jgi:integrase
MPKKLITGQREADLCYEPGLHPVANATGLFLKVARGGSQSWIYRFTLGGKARDMGLGSAGATEDNVTLDEAIELARAARKLRGQRIDPIADRDAKLAKQREAEVKKSNARTFKESAREYLAEHSPGWKNEKHRQQWFNSLDNYVYPTIGNMPVQDVDVTAVLEVLRPLTDRAETCLRVCGRIETVINFATVKQYRQGDNPAKWSLLKHALKLKKRKVKHHPALNYRELPQFMADLRSRSSVSAACLEFLILTAARTSEVIEAPWSEISTAKRVWKIPAARMKGDEDHEVPLTDAALAVLKRMKAEQSGDLVFGLSNNALLKMLTIMERGDITVHGFRSTFSDWAHARGFQHELIELCLAHDIETIVGKPAAAYWRDKAVDERGKIMQAWSDYCGGATADNVVKLKAAS